MSSAQRTLWLIRHARPIGMDGVCYGASDCAVAPDDTLQASLALQPELSSLPASQVQVWVSQRQRAQDLATALTRLSAWPAARVDARLNEFDFGRWEGVRWSDVPKDAMDAWVGDFADHRFGGGDSTQALLDRVAQALAQARQAACPHVVWVTHAGVIRAVRWLLASKGQRMPLTAHNWPREAVAFGQCVWLSDY